MASFKLDHHRVLKVEVAVESRVKLICLRAVVQRLHIWHKDVPAHKLIQHTKRDEVPLGSTEIDHEVGHPMFHAQLTAVVLYDFVNYLYQKEAL